MAHNHTMDDYSKNFIIARDSAIAVTCVLSILGAAAIILSFLLLREVRTSVRFLLLNLSIADLLVAVTNLVSMPVLYHYSMLNKTINNTVCQVTGGVGLFATNSSILWTMVVVVYLYISMACTRPSKRVNQVVMILVTIFCWVLPAVVTIVFAIKRFFRLAHTGFCTPTTSDTLYIPILGYDIFLIPAFVILPLLSIGFILHMSYKMKHQEHHYSHYTLWRRRAEMKLVFVAIVFILIRVWGLVIEIMKYFFKQDDGYTEAAATMYFLAGIGDSSQGFVNGIFFCLLTPGVRQRLCHMVIKYLCCGYVCCSKDVDEYKPLLHGDDEKKVQYGLHSWRRKNLTNVNNSRSHDPDSMLSIHGDPDTSNSSSKSINEV